jgi:hypothetical protein
MNRLGDMAIEGGGGATRLAPIPYEITLTWSEMKLAAYVAVGAKIACMQRGARHAHGATDAGMTWDTQIVSAQGEIAVSKYLNLYWSGLSDIIKAVDVGGENGAEVRTRTQHWYELMLHKTDNDRPFVLVTAERPPAFRLVGWILGRDGKLQKYWGEHGARGRPAFFVPHSELLPMAELKARVGGPAYVERAGL